MVHTSVHDDPTCLTFETVFEHSAKYFSHNYKLNFSRVIMQRRYQKCKHLPSARANTHTWSKIMKLLVAVQLCPEHTEHCTFTFVSLFVGHTPGSELFLVFHSPFFSNGMHFHIGIPISTFDFVVRIFTAELFSLV